MAVKNDGLKTGRILKAVGGFYYVEAEDAVYECRARGKFRLDRVTPLVGDRTEFEVTSGVRGYLLKILGRKNSFVRPPVSNIDTMVITASAAPPVTDPFLIDRLLAVTIHKGIEPLLVFNKSDLRAADEFLGVYSSAGIQCLLMSAVTNEGRDELKRRLSGRLCAFAGNSGVGKSSILNALDPELSLETGALNEKLGRGRHTTRHIELLRLDSGTLVADTPGFSSFELTADDAMKKEELASLFPEFRPFLGGCRFVGCAHVKEEACAVREALDDGKIDQGRYMSYLRLYKKLSEFLPWETKNKR